MLQVPMVNGKITGDLFFETPDQTPENTMTDIANAILGFLSGQYKDMTGQLYNDKQWATDKQWVYNEVSLYSVQRESDGPQNE
jgi:hypothetical protein